MIIKQVTLSVCIALILALLASFVSLSRQLPAPLLHFLVALGAAALSLLAGSRLQPSSAGSSRPAAKATDQRQQGTVKWFNPAKGFGFITRDDGQDIFVHYRSIQGSSSRALREGQRVDFVPGMGSKGPQAEDVRPLSR